MMNGMKKSFSTFFNEKGLTLVEILASLVILSIVVVSLMPMFVQSSHFNQSSKKIEDATYIAESNMEDLFHLSTSSVLSDGIVKLSTIEGYNQVSNCPIGYCYEKKMNNHYVFIQLKNSSNNGLMDGVVSVYSDSTMTKKEAQMETLLNWSSK